MSETSRRAEMTKWVPAERAIYDAVRAVEEMSADARLTDAVVLLGEARRCVADYVDGVERRDPYAAARAEGHQQGLMHLASAVQKVLRPQDVEQLIAALRMGI